MEKIRTIINKVFIKKQDQRRFSIEKHEIVYVKKLALKLRRHISKEKRGIEFVPIQVDDLKRLCDYIIKVKVLK